MQRLAILGLASVLMSGSAWAVTDTGYIDLAHRHSDIDVAGLGSDADTTTLSGATAFDFQNSLQLHLDGQVSEANSTLADDTTFGGTAHLATRQDSWMFGGFAGGFSSDTFDLMSGGVEGALYFNRFTVAGALAYADTDIVNTEAVILQTQGRFFVTENFRVDAVLDYVDYEIAGVSAEAPVVGAGVEYKFGEMPMSIFGAYSHLDSDDLALTTDTATIGVRFNLDRTLAHRDRSGASLVSAASYRSLF